jgi:dipicolinate synthase subunit A
LERAHPFHVLVIGGDARQIEVARVLSVLYKRVNVFGHPSQNLPDTVDSVADLSQALSDAEIIILPISGMTDAGMVRGYQGDPLIDFGNHFPGLKENTLIVTGQMTQKWLNRSAEMGVKVIQYADDDRIAIPNSIPTAEGAAQIAMEELPITIHGSTVIVCGFGRVGRATAGVFKSLGARVIVTARRQALLDRAFELGLEAVFQKDLAEIIGSADLIINTIPALVLGAQELAKVSPEALIIDLASPPGGTDFEAAEKLKLKAILAPGLPGKVAPKTAGKILASAIPQLIADFWNGGGGR